MDYCDAPDEVAKNPHIKSQLLKLANGNEDAFRFMWTLWNWEHVLDDLVDRDKPVVMDNAAHYFLTFTRELTFNRFYIDNAAYLFGLIASATIRWCDGEEFERSESKLKQAQSSTIKCGDIDVYLGVAYLVGGWEHVRKCKGFRSYDLNGLEFANQGET